MKKIRLLLVAFSVMLCMFVTTFYVAQTSSVFAASSTSSSSKISANNLKIKLSTTKYTYNGKEKKPKVKVTYKGKTVDSKNYTVKYSSGRKLPGTYKVTVNFKGKYTGKKTLSYKILIEAPLVECVNNTESIEMVWDKTSKASGYLIYDSDKSLIKKTKNTSTVVKNLDPGTKCVFYIRSYAKLNDKNYYSSYVKVETATKPSISGTKTLYIGAEKNFKAKASGSVKWSSSDKSIATVSSKGKVTALNTGTVKIKAKANGVTASYTLTVKKPEIKLNKTSLKLEEYGIATLKATTSPSGISVKWYSSDTSIAKISSNGKITAISPGTTTITAKGTYLGKTYKKTCKVVVEPFEESGFNILKLYMEKYGYENSYGEKFIITTSENGKYTDSFTIYYDSDKDRFEFSALSECNEDDGIGVFIDFYIDNESEIEDIEAILVHYVDGYVVGSGGAIAELDLNTYTTETELCFEWQPGTTNYIKNSKEDCFNSFLQVAFLEWEQLIYDCCGVYMSDLGFTSY